MNHETAAIAPSSLQRTAFAPLLVSHGAFDAACAQLSAHVAASPAPCGATLLLAPPALIVNTDGDEEEVAPELPAELLAAAAALLAVPPDSLSNKRHSHAFLCDLIVQAAAKLSPEPALTAADRLAHAAQQFCESWKLQVFESVFVNPTHFVWQSQGNIEMAEAALLECSHLYMALLEALVPIKFGRSALLQARVNGVFPFLDKAITGERVHSHLLEHIGNPRKVGTSIPPLPEALRIDAESFIAPPESIFSLRETELLYTVEMAVDEILCDESLLNQFQPYLELYASLLTPEAMLEPFFDYLSSKDLLATVLHPVFETFMDSEADVQDVGVPIPSNHSSRNTNPFGNAQTGTQYDNMFSVSTASPFYSPQNTTTGTSAPADSRSESETANRPVADVMSWLFEPDSEILNSMFSTSPSGSSVASTVAVTTAIQTYQKEFRYDRFKKLLDFVGITNADVECVFVSRFPAAIMSTTTRLPRLSRSGSVSSEESWGTVSTTVGNCVDEGMFSGVRIGLKDLMMQDWLVHDCRDTHENDEDDDENEDIWPWESTVDDDVDGLIL